jgi:hypothetical protein
MAIPKKRGKSARGGDRRAGLKAAPDECAPG